MSRWGALKTDKNEQRGRGSRVIKESLTVDSNKHREDRESLLRRYASIRQRCRTEASLHAIEELARFLNNTSVDVLPAEELAKDVVQDIFLTYLSESTPEHLQLRILDALIVLLRNSRHASAMMAPLIGDEIVEGSEKEISNPVRCSLFEILQRKLLASSSQRRDESFHLLERTCQCLILALQMATSIDGTKKHAGSLKMDLDLGVVQRFVMQVLQRGGQGSFRLRRLSLELLYALLRRHPESAVSLTMPLLVNSRQEGRAFSRTCSACGYRGTSMLLDTLHESDSSAECRLVSDCTIELLNHAPFGLWLQQRQTVNNARRTSGFQQQVLLGIERTIRTAHCCLSRRNRQQYMDSLCLLAKAILLKIPYCSDDRVGSLAVELVETMAKNLTDPTCSLKERKPIEDVLVESMGGRITPHGDKTVMTLPARTWLCGDQGLSFVKDHLQNESAGGSNVASSTKLLQAILKSHPWMISNVNSDLWGLFARFVVRSSESGLPKIRQEALQLVDAFLHGRNEHGVTSETVHTRAVLQLVLPFLRKSIEEGNSSSKATSCGAYGAFLPTDWNVVGDGNIEDGGDGCLCQFDLILKLCRDLETSNKVRGEAWKAIGDMCSSYFSIGCQRAGGGRFSSEGSIVCERVCQALVEAVDDLNSSVRSMAVFAAGNIAQALRCLSNPELPDIHLLTQLAQRVLDRTVDDDVKVAGNAIRAISHFSCLVSRTEYASALKKADLDLLRFLDMAIHSLTNKVEKAIALSLGDGKNRSWRERQAIKKHGWGACNSLANMFESDIITVAGQEAVSKAVNTLLECVQQMRVLHEKVVVSSMYALRCMAPNTLSQISGKGEALVGAATGCLLRISDQDTHLGKHKLEQEAEALLAHLLRSFTSADARRLILSVQVNSSHLDFLYQWMVEKDCPAEAFDAFALAMQSSYVQIDVQTEQRFSSRALSLLPSSSDLEDEL